MRAVVAVMAASSRRVLILVENAPVPSDRRVINEAESLHAAGYTVSVICPADPGEALSESIHGIEVRRYVPRHAHGTAASQVLEYLHAMLQTFRLMLSLSRSPGFDVIHACNPPDLFFALAWPFRLFGTRFIFDQHDLSPELYEALFGRSRGLVMSALRWSERRSYRACDAALVSNGSYKQLACARSGIDADKVFVVRNGPRADWPRDVGADASLKRGREHLVVYMGVMGYQDGVDVLLDAAAHLIHDLGVDDVTFALVGHGNASEALERQAEELGIADHVDFTGWVYDEDVLSRYLLTADVCACPEPSSPLNDKSTFIKVMEYMAASAPVVAFDLPETRVSAGDAALYAPSGDVEGFAEQIRAVLEDPGLRQRMREAAAARIDTLRWEHQVPQMLAAYEHALA